MDKMFTGSVVGIAAGVPIGIISYVINKLEICNICLIYVAGGLFGRTLLPDDASVAAIIVGWITHLVVSALMGVVFISLISLTGKDYLYFKGIIFGCAIWFIDFGVISPLAGYLPSSPTSTDLLILLGYHLAFALIMSWAINRFVSIRNPREQR